MKTEFNLTNAQAAVAEYVAALNDPKRIPTRTAARSFIEPLLEKHGILQTWRGMGFTESHAPGYASD